MSVTFARILHVSGSDGLVVSASLPTSPQGSDHLFLFGADPRRGPAYGL
jgi:hypothetical protein